MLPIKPGPTEVSLLMARDAISSNIKVIIKTRIIKLIHSRLIIAILFAVSFLLFFAATANGQNIAIEKVTLGLKDESLETAIKRIEKQTDLRFYYRDEDIKPLDHLNLEPATRTIEQTLVALLQNTNLNFKQVDKNILLQRNAREIFYQISGRVVDSIDKKPIANASIFLSNSTVGVTTNDDGTFKLNVSKSGKYQVIVTVIGYATYQGMLFMDNQNINVHDIELVPKVIKLSEVKVQVDPNWDRNYRWFKEEFLGRSGFADKCKIINPEVLELSYDEKTKMLKGSSTDILEIENNALGYKLKYVLSDFTDDRIINKVTYKGLVLFEQLPGDKNQQLKWKKNRLKAYNGSIMHFLRSVLYNQLSEEGFVVYQLKRKPIPTKTLTQSPIKYIDSLAQTPLQINDFIEVSNKKGIYAMAYKDCLYVMYTKLHNYTGNLEDIPAASQPGYAKTIVTFTAPNTFFDDNGIIVNPESLVYEGYWAKIRVAELLPSDYSPDN
ncbi:carboxypeptidase-like regulatory domain-containing protein [Mucilaginibacter sp.]|uniref:carboxypeptidase-like regulatory domain-containing protein n=1 Tax=Mucilaginibacter sp. TaxID=1882438 RepID=UPI00284C98EC|nr:carboxypeptidase-like regulatory domain-containing protein [Mucilaginibacter sp.]MDR3693003.1 carboxypeptidase-like regulatory domain-containing protein [Mucilaginibacter sp.]